MLYFFLAAVSDKDGLSFYSDTSIAVRLRMTEAAVVAARDELVAEDLVAYRAPLVQVLSLPRAAVESRGGVWSTSARCFARWRARLLMSIERI